MCYESPKFGGAGYTGEFEAPAGLDLSKRNESYSDFCKRQKSAYGRRVRLASARRCLYGKKF